MVRFSSMTLLHQFSAVSDLRHKRSGGRWAVEVGGTSHGISILIMIEDKEYIMLSDPLEALLHYYV
jgi:hypothetical protein